MMDGIRESAVEVVIIVAAAVLAATALIPRPASSHIVREEPWHPVAGAYLRSLFYLGLPPVDWELVAREYEQPLQYGDGEANESRDPGNVYDLVERSRAAGATDHAAAIRSAIEAHDAEALYVASTRAMAGLVRGRLQTAAERLDEPAAARRELQEAQQLFRPFARFVRETDPEAFARLGRAWLELSTSASGSRVVRIAHTTPKPDGFGAAREIVDSYLRDAFGSVESPPPQSWAPLPGTVLGEGGGPDVAPWLPPGSDLNDQDPLPRLNLNFEARGIDEKDLFLVAYGDMLFDSPMIVGEPARSVGIACSTCHNRGDVNRRFFIPGVSHQAGAADVDGAFFNQRFNDHRRDSLDIPSLRGIRFTGPYGRDGRFASLRDFVRNVIVQEFNGPEPTPLMLDALVAYLFEFDWLPSPYLEPDGTLNEEASAAARRGEELFTREFSGMGDRSCATCHVPSANFVDGLRHDIGSGDPASPGARDSFFDTPTLINAAHTAPYFHDGSLETLADVVAWFDGRFELGLDEGERADLTAYLEAVGAAEEPYEIFDEENTRFRLDFGELSTFASTLETLIPARDEFHTMLLVRTVASDLRLDASGLQDRSQAPKVYELADQLEEIGVAVQAGEWSRAADLWEGYQALEAEYGPGLR